MLYIDIFFLINSLLDFVLLLILALWKREPFLLKRGLVASALGGLWACMVSIIPMYPFFESYGVSWIKILTIYPIAFLMTGITFPKKTKKMKRDYAFCFLIISWMAAGFLNFLYYQIYEILFPEKQATIFQQIVVMLLGGGVALWGILGYREKERQEMDVIYLTELKLCGRKETMKALWDSGNRLCTMTGEPVCIVEEQVMEKLMKEQWNVLKNWASTEGTLLAQMGFQLISYHCIGREEGVLPAIRGEQITIHKDGETIVIDHPIIGYCASSLQREKHSYEMILPSAYGLQLWK